MFNKVTRDELRYILKDLGLTRSIDFYGSDIMPTVRSTEAADELRYSGDLRERLKSEVHRLDKDDDRITEEIERVEDKLDLLLEFLGLEYDKEPRIIKKKKGKK